MSEAKYTRKVISALDAVKDGADVYSYSLAKTLRGIERKHPELIDITKPMMYRGDGTDQVPYFGAICTKVGKAQIKSQKKVLARREKT